MTNLPQLHDWFWELLTPGQWFVTWILSFIAFWIWWGLSWTKEDPEMAGPAFWAAFTAVPLVGGVVWCLLNFVSFLIFMWFLGV